MTYLQREFPISAIRIDERRRKGWYYIFYELWKSQSQRNCMERQILFGIIGKNKKNLTHNLIILQESNPNVAVTFYWLPLRKQVRIEGTASKISREASEEYFHKRPRASQVCCENLLLSFKFIVDYSLQ